MELGEANCRHSKANFLRRTASASSISTAAGSQPLEVATVMEELMKFTYLMRGVSDYLTNRYSERKEESDKLSTQAGVKAD
jgi:hypothetical protein